jgi:hypothetical protein
MAGQQSSAGAGEASADAVQENIDKLHEGTDRGAGNQEPDPATAENPPQQAGGEGDSKRKPD